ncbi:hypothetical protein [Bradyrhizobium sp. 33ap4]|uniref:hypothetical protein n=1 Tax=Bradyrhizobium sp. 33ap4 TaxID=3061630 RepID=UPI00292FC372|nr:hypothetical protein [Bradyrhizobium sp. 33ap4]
MTMQSPDIAGFRFSTADFGERDRLPIFREQIGRMIVKLDPEPLSVGAFHAEAKCASCLGSGSCPGRAATSRSHGRASCSTAMTTLC